MSFHTSLFYIFIPLRAVTLSYIKEQLISKSFITLKIKNAYFIHDCLWLLLCELMWLCGVVLCGVVLESIKNIGASSLRGSRLLRGTFVVNVLKRRTYRSKASKCHASRTLEHIIVLWSILLLIILLLYTCMLLTQLCK